MARLASASLGESRRVGLAYTMWQVYILFSRKDWRTYTGSTDNLTRRLVAHTQGYVHATKDRRPLEVAYTVDCPHELAARKLERYYKSAAGRRKLKIILGDLKEKYSGVV